jgi:hypothetical protein
MNLAAVLMERAGEDGLGGFLGEADIEAVNAAAAGQVYGPEELAVGMKLDHPLPASGGEKFFHQSHGLEYLQGTWMNDGRSIPVVRSGLGVDELARDPSAIELGGEEETGRARSDNQHCGLTACCWIHRWGSIQTIGVGWRVVNPVTFSRREELRYAR